MKRKKIIIILFIFAMSLFVGKETYSYYISRFNVEVTSSSSNIICDADISEVNSNEKNKFGYSEFKVTVRNYDDSDVVTGENFNYTLSIINNDNSNGEFGYNNSFNSNLQLTGQMTNTSLDTNEYIIQVKSTSGLSENVSYKVLLNCTQTN